jgi:1,4-dihydroxy-2-naphthoate octaprenyltransferase
MRLSEFFIYLHLCGFTCWIFAYSLILFQFFQLNLNEKIPESICLTFHYPIFSYFWLVLETYTSISWIKKASNNVEYVKAFTWTIWVIMDFIILFVIMLVGSERKYDEIGLIHLEYISNRILAMVIYISLSIVIIEWAKSRKIFHSCKYIYGTLGHSFHLLAIIPKSFSLTLSLLPIGNLLCCPNLIIKSPAPKKQTVLGIAFWVIVTLLVILQFHFEMGPLNTKVLVLLFFIFPELIMVSSDVEIDYTRGHPDLEWKEHVCILNFFKPLYDIITLQPLIPGNPCKHVTWIGIHNVGTTLFVLWSLGLNSWTAAISVGSFSAVGFIFDWWKDCDSCEDTNNSDYRSNYFKKRPIGLYLYTILVTVIHVCAVLSTEYPIHGLFVECVLLPLAIGPFYHWLKKNSFTGTKTWVVSLCGTLMTAVFPISLISDNVLSLIITKDFFFVAIAITLREAATDLVYDCRDIDGDKKAGKRTYPVVLGTLETYKLARRLHLISAIFFILCGSVSLAFCGIAMSLVLTISYREYNHLYELFALIWYISYF